ncbi:hypothetical protein GUJ93_ZPchr0009g2011 [Zizania palustris]|uniref:Uncharacterized protein n=1 Tax=Zizania palustris TaxID=103762 RepID=A0A8J5R932_ZIZPA|nr:hypothetical protein GUJ93_ZPchr0009g2011 [Zizania palustris]
MRRLGGRAGGAACPRPCGIRVRLARPTHRARAPGRARVRRHRATCAGTRRTSPFSLTPPAVQVHLLRLPFPSMSRLRCFCFPLHSCLLFPSPGFLPVAGYRGLSRVPVSSLLSELELLGVVSGSLRGERG